MSTALRVVGMLGAVYLLTLGACGSDDAASGSSRPNPSGTARGGAGPETEDPRLGESAAGAGGAGGTAGTANACAGLDSSQPTTFYLSADDSNSMASPVIARRQLSEGKKVSPGVLRTYEFLNYYNVGYPAASEGSVGLFAEMGTDPEGYALQLAVSAEAPPLVRRNMNLTFVLDTSGSMTGTPIDLERAAVLAIAGSLRAGDVVSIVTWNTSNAIVMNSHVVTGPDDSTLRQAAGAISAGGGTDLHGGLTAGYGLAQQNFLPGLLNRVILISDGNANVGITDEEIIGRGAALNDGDGIYLVGIGTGGGVNDTLMDRVTDAGRGAYVYLDSVSEANTMFGPRFDEVMDVAARSVRVELQLPWYMGIQRFYGEEYSTNPRTIEPQHLAPGDAMVFNQVVSPCDTSHFSQTDPVQLTARWQTPGDHQNRSQSLQTTLGELLAADTPYLPKAKAIIAYAEALKATGDQRAKLTEARTLVLAADPSGVDPELAEILSLIDQALTIY